MSPLPDVHIVQVNYFYKDDILRSLASIFESHKNSETRFIITVVDNSPEQGLEIALKERFPQVRYINAKKNIGVGQASNLGFAKERARYYFALNPDTLLNRTEDLLKKMVDYLDAHPQVGAIGPKILYEDGEHQDSMFRFDLPSLAVKPFRHTALREFPLIAKNISRLLMQDRNKSEIQKTDWLLGAALMVRDEAAQNVGFFDPRFFLYLEDCDWCRRLWERGWEVHYVPTVELVHKYGRASSAEKNSAIVSAIMAFFKKQTTRAHMRSWITYLWKWRHRHTSYVR